MMRQSKIINWPGPDDEVTVRELTVAELDSLLDGGDEVTMLDYLYGGDGISGELLAAASGLDMATLSGQTPSALAPLIEAVREVNKVFFRAARDHRRRMAALTGQPSGPASAGESAG